MYQQKLEGNMNWEFEQYPMKQKRQCGFESERHNRLISLTIGEGLTINNENLLFFSNKIESSNEVYICITTKDWEMCKRRNFEKIALGLEENFTFNKNIEIYLYRIELDRIDVLIGAPTSYQICKYSYIELPEILNSWKTKSEKSPRSQPKVIYEPKYIPALLSLKREMLGLDKSYIIKEINISLKELSAIENGEKQLLSFEQAKIFSNTLGFDLEIDFIEDKSSSDMDNYYFNWKIKSYEWDLFFEHLEKRRMIILDIYLKHYGKQKRAQEPKFIKNYRFFKKTTM